MKYGLSLADNDRYQDCCVAHQDKTVDSDVENLFALLIIRHFVSLKNNCWDINEKDLKHGALPNQPIIAFLTRKSCHKLLFPQKFAVGNANRLEGDDITQSKQNFCSFSVVISVCYKSLVVVVHVVFKLEEATPDSNV